MRVVFCLHNNPSVALTRATSLCTKEANKVCELYNNPSVALTRATSLCTKEANKDGEIYI